MEPKQKGAKTTKEGEDGRSSSSSSGSAESASSEFSLDERGNLARENKGFDKGKLQPETSSSLESPLAQVMEMPSESSEYRIPAHVFAPSTPTNAGDWSSASNESLFSIHNGNMSFTRDAYLMKSGELPALSPIGLQKSGEMTSVTPDSKKSGEEIISAHFNTPSPSQSIPSEAAVDSGNGTKIDEIKKGKSSLDEISHHSNASGQSFAFPVLANFDKQKSVNSGASRVERQKDVDSVKDENENTPKDNTDETAANTSSSSSSWFSCLSCCSCLTSKQK